MPYPSHWFDIMALGIVFGMVSAGFWRGFLGEIFPALALAAGFLAAMLVSGKTASLEGVISAGMGREGTAFGVAFAVGWSVVTAAGVAAKRYVFQSNNMTIADRAAGVALGFAKGALLVAIITTGLGFIPSIKKDVAEKSYSGSTFITAGKFVMEKLAPGLAGKMDKQMKDLPMDKVGEKVKEAMELKKKADKLGLTGPAKSSGSGQEKGGAQGGR